MAVSVLGHGKGDAWMLSVAPLRHGSGENNSGEQSLGADDDGGNAFGERMR